jgi:uncharacterized protein
MNAHASSILLGVRDMDRSKRFYTEGLGWNVQRDYKVSVFFEPTRSWPKPRKAGATILKPSATLEWGGYGGSFADPDGYIWSIGYSAQGKDQPYAE